MTAESQRHLQAASGVSVFSHGDGWGPQTLPMILARFFPVAITSQQRDLIGYLWRLGLMNRKQCLSDSFVGVPGSHAGSDEPRKGETSAMGSTETSFWPVPASKAPTGPIR